MKPTIIGNGDSSPKKKPTVIGSTPPPPAKVVEVKKPSVSVIPGKMRNRIPATRESLKQKHQLKDSVLDKAIQIIQNTNQDELTLSNVVFWGQNLQEQHNALVNETLRLAQSEVVSTVTGHVYRMLEILGDIQLEKVFEEKPSFLSGVFRKNSEEIDSPEELDEALREIEQLSKLLHERISELVILREKLESNSKQLQELGDEIEASLVSAMEIADYFNQNLSEKDMAARLQERANSLTLTLGQIRSDGLMRNSHIEQPMNLTSLVQEVVLNTLPTWITNVTAMRMALHGKHKPNPTDVSEISRTMKTIIRKLG